jgi:multicomponent Na+:H+ antiporter subunit C
MSAPVLYAVVGGLLFCLGLYGLVAAAHVLRRIVAVNVMGSGVFLVFVAAAARAPGMPADPVPHAMVLTGIVVAVSATAVALALMVRYHEAGREEDAGDG